MPPAELNPAAGGDPDVIRPTYPRRVVLIWLERSAHPACTGEGQRWLGADEDHKNVTIFFGPQSDTAEGLCQGRCLIRPRSENYFFSTTTCSLFSFGPIGFIYGLIVAGYGEGREGLIA
jgi:hypothetical protein